jgi:hypothetical protein
MAWHSAPRHPTVRRDEPFEGGCQSSNKCRRAAGLRASARLPSKSGAGGGFSRCGRLLVALESRLPQRMGRLACQARRPMLHVPRGEGRIAKHRAPWDCRTGHRPGAHKVNAPALVGFPPCTWELRECTCAGGHAGRPGRARARRPAVRRGGPAYVQCRTQRVHPALGQRGRFCRVP